MGGNPTNFGLAPVTGVAKAVGSGSLESVSVLPIGIATNPARSAIRIVSFSTTGISLREVKMAANRGRATEGLQQNATRPYLSSIFGAFINTLTMSLIFSSLPCYLLFIQ